MFFKKKEEFNVDQFWSDYEEKTGEKVIAKSLGQYLSGWDEFAIPLWGLVIATSGGFRFHHFPHEGWFMILSRVSTGREPPKEKTLFIPREAIKEAELIVEKRLWKKILASSRPILSIRCNVDGIERNILFETDTGAGVVADALKT